MLVPKREKECNRVLVLSADYTDLTDFHKNYTVGNHKDHVFVNYFCKDIINIP
jgi:hypothetical protein